MDSRSNPVDVLKIKPIESIVLRNPGGRIWTALPDILAIDARFDISQIIIFQHSDCGTSYLDESLIVKKFGESVKPDDSENVKIRDDVIKYKVHNGEQSVRDDLALLKKQTYLRKELIDTAVGLYMDTHTGLIKRV
ncbi:hypothetical protein BT63DRAFT_424175, partial [Microthyrium microscopicum]